MTTLTLIRHGQANTEARDEASYDRLSPLGHQQSAWLGAYLQGKGPMAARLYTGTLTRHIETARAMETGLDPTADPRLNEIEYFTLSTLLHQQHGIAVPTSREDFVAHLPKTFTAWREGRIDGAPETFDHFETRVRDALADILNGSGPALIVTSGGLIAMAMRQALGLEVTAMTRMTLAIMNSSLHQLHPIGGSLAPVLFNAVPHLDRPDRRYAQTHL